MFALELETRLYYLSITITTDPSSAQMGFEFDNFSNLQSLISNIERVIMTRCVRKMITHPALRRRGDVAATSLCTSQWRRRYVSNETPNDVLMERCQDVSVVRLYVLLERHNDVSKGRNNDAPSLRLHDVSNKSQMKHPTTSR